MEAHPEEVVVEEDEILQIKTISAEVVVSDADASSTATSTESDGQLDEMARDLLRDELEDDQEDRLSQKWKKPGVSGVEMVQKMLEKGLTPRQMLRSILGPECPIPVEMPESIALKYFLQLASERRYRDRLPQFNDFQHAVQLFKQSKRILFITGAGISVSCGIPDFRSSRGIYAELKKTYAELPHPTSMFDIAFFRSCPQPFFSFAKELFPGAHKPSISHMFIRFLEIQEQLLRVYTQNIDTLEQVAGIERRVECHGSFGAATCLDCGQKYTCDEIREDIYAQPVSLIPYNVEDDVPQILINKENIPSYNADIKLLGDCDAIITALCMAMGGRLQELMLEELKSRPNFAEVHAKMEERRQSSEDGHFPQVITQSEVLKMLGAEEAADDTRDGKPAYVKLDPNLNVFAGAEMWFDRDSRTFGPLPRQADSPPSSPSDCDGDSSDSSGISDSQSAPPHESSPFVVLSPAVATPQSCPNSFGNDDESRQSAGSDSS
ncbi:Deacetylase sirtuin-type domain-containing protein [Aphelenchoides fujianensis]|nr:Deacetylase sirtuin-type domain-containing protein [Aphelenchoides fujianensis]